MTLFDLENIVANTKNISKLMAFTLMVGTSSLVNCQSAESSGKSKDSRQSCFDDYDCPGGAEIRCIDGYCEDTSNIEEVITVNGINIKTKHTNSNGYTSFNDDQTGELVGINIADKHTGNPLSNVKVTFFDGDGSKESVLNRKNGFEAFMLMKKGYVNHFEVFAHNSGHNFSMESTAFTVWEYIHDQDAEKYNAMENYMEWSKDNNYAFVTCVSGEELKKAQGTVGNIFSVVGEYYPNPVITLVNYAFEIITTLEDLGYVETYPHKSYNLLNPYNFTAPSISVGFDGECNTECVPNCSTVECGYDPVCGTEYCGDCGTNENCQNGSCIPITTCSDDCDYVGQKGCNSPSNPGPVPDGQPKECDYFDEDPCLDSANVSEFPTGCYGIKNCCKNGDCVYDPSCS